MNITVLHKKFCKPISENKTDINKEIDKYVKEYVQTFKECNIEINKTTINNENVCHIVPLVSTPLHAPTKFLIDRVAIISE